MKYKGTVRRRRNFTRHVRGGVTIESSGLAETVYSGPWRGSRAEAADDAVGYLRRRYGTGTAETRLEGGEVYPRVLDPIVGGQYWPDVRERAEPEDIGQLSSLEPGGGA